MFLTFGMHFGTVFCRSSSHSRRSYAATEARRTVDRASRYGTSGWVRRRPIAHYRSFSSRYVTCSCSRDVQKGVDESEVRNPRAPELNRKQGADFHAMFCRDLLHGRALLDCYLIIDKPTARTGTLFWCRQILVKTGVSNHTYPDGL